MQRCSVVDLTGPLPTQRTRTSEGFLEVPARLSKAGNVQTYLRSELGLDGSGTFRIYRPADEVFAPEALKSAGNKTLTLKHPPKGVSIANWSAVAVGDVRDVTAAGDHTAGIVTIKDPDAIKALEDGTREMSCGYDFDLDIAAGVSPSGEAYDGIGRSIRINHHAIVDTARGGHGCRIADATSNRTPGERTMAMKNLVIDNVRLGEIEESQANLVQLIADNNKAALKVATDAATSATARAEAAEAEVVTLKAAAAKSAADHATAVAELSGKILTDAQVEEIAVKRATAITDAQVETLAAERATVVAAAIKLVDGFSDAGKTVAAIRTEVLTAILAEDSDLSAKAKAGLGGVAPDKADATVSKIVFAMLAAEPKTSTGDDGSTAVLDATARALAGDGRGKPKYTPEDIMRYRMKHGKDPVAAA